MAYAYRILPGTPAQKAERALRASVVMISGCKDSQTSADVYDTSDFGIDNGPGGAGGACTNSMIQALQEDQYPTWATLLHNMRTILRRSSYTQVPMLSTSSQMDLKTTPFTVMQTPPKNRRALLIGINYTGTKNELRGCHNDVETMRRFLKNRGYADGEINILRDNGTDTVPTHKHIHIAMLWLIDGAKAGDSLFLHYSGHGTSVADQDGDEADGRDEALVPCDFETGGLLRDDEILQTLVMPLLKGVLLTCVFDCCHSGTIMDLPYVFRADNEEAFNSPALVQNPAFKADLVYSIAQALGIGFRAVDCCCDEETIQICVITCCMEILCQVLFGACCPEP